MSGGVGLRPPPMPLWLKGQQGPMATASAALLSLCGLGRSFFLLEGQDRNFVFNGLGFQKVPSFNELDQLG